MGGKFSSEGMGLFLRVQNIEFFFALSGKRSARHARESIGTVISPAHAQRLIQRWRESGYLIKGKMYSYSEKGEALAKWLRECPK